MFFLFFAQGHVDAAELLQVRLEGSPAWDILHPGTPNRVRLGLLSPAKKHLLDSCQPTSHIKNTLSNKVI